MSTMARHRARALRESLACRYCPSVFSTKNEQIQHTEEIHKVFKCQLCKRVFDTREKYSNHIQDEHDGKDREYMACERCGQQFRLVNQLKIHVESKCGTEKMFSCDECGLKYMTKSTLNTHKMKHKGHLSYECSFCEKRFLNKGQLTVHKRMHTGEKPYKCDQCPKMFAYRESLVTHSSLHTGVKPFMCECCHQTFSCIGNFKKHRRSRPNTCGLPEYDRSIKVAPRPSIKNPGSLTMQMRNKVKPRKVLKEEDKKIKTKNKLQDFADICLLTACGAKLSDSLKEDSSYRSSNEMENKTDNYVFSNDENESQEENTVEFIAYKGSDCEEELDTSELIEVIEMAENVEDDENTNLSRSTGNELVYEIDYTNDCNNDNEAKSSGLYLILPESKIESQETVYSYDQNCETSTESTSIEFIPNTEDDDDQCTYRLIEKFDEEKSAKDIEINTNDEFEVLQSELSMESVKDETLDENVYEVEILETESQSLEDLENVTHSKGSHPCPFCPKVYQLRISFIKHLFKDHRKGYEDVYKVLPKTLENNSALTCKYCDKLYLSQTALDKHEAGHGTTGKLLHKCFCCDEFFTSLSEVAKHAWENHPEKVICRICERKFPDPDSLTSHCRLAHKPNKEKTKSTKPMQLACANCGEMFYSKTTLSDHERSLCGSCPQYKCDDCGKSYHSSGSLKTHKSIHTGELPFKCSYCDKAFRTRGQVKVHQRKHSGEKPFQCDMCPKAFAYRENLLIHFSIHTGMQRFQCNNCCARFSCITNLQSHRRIHKKTCGAKPNVTKPVGKMLGVVHGSVYVGDKSNVQGVKNL